MQQQGGLVAIQQAAELRAVLEERLDALDCHSGATEDDRRPVTLQFPDERQVMPERFRGFVHNDVPRCTACLACAKDCPVDCIYEGERMLYIHPDECVDCGACEPVCPVEAIGEDENGVYRIDEDLCTSCMLCVDACPYEVIVENNRTSMPIKCTNCGACVDVCPRDAIETV